MGCSHLSVKPRSGKCHACENRYLPCQYSLLGCTSHVFHPMHSRERRSCTTHKKQACPFHAKSEIVRCKTLFCSNLRKSAKDSLCVDCLSGNLPCLNRCHRRTAMPTFSTCDLCRASGSLSGQPSMCDSKHCLPTSTFTPEATASLCGTDGCDNLVLDHTICPLCASSCFPCRRTECKSRTVPGFSYLNGSAMCRASTHCCQHVTMYRCIEVQFYRFGLVGSALLKTDPRLHHQYV